MNPSQLIVQEANQTFEVKDSMGRTLTLRRLNALDRLRLLKAAGPELSQNDAWLNIAALAVCVVEMNGIPRTAPATERQIENIVSELGDPGLEAIMSVLAEQADNTLLLMENAEGNSVGTLS